jgi:hypothetical protein
VRGHGTGGVASRVAVVGRGGCAEPGWFAGVGPAVR